MKVPTLSADLSPLSIRREVRYTLVRMSSLGWAKPYVATFDSLLAICDAHVATEQKLRDAVEDAEAALDQVDDELDEVALYLNKFIKAETSGLVRANLLKALFDEVRPSRFVRPRLGEELDRVRTWPTLLAGAPLAKLVSLGTTVADIIKRCDKALASHAQATADLANFGLNVFGPFVAKVNGERQLLAGEARKQQRLDGSEAGEGLFRSLTTARRREALTLATVSELIAAAEEEVATLRSQKAELEAAAKAAAEGEAERARKAAELVQLQIVSAEAAAKAKALKAELAKK